MKKKNQPVSRNIQKIRNSEEWTSIVIKYVTEDKTITNTEKAFAKKIIQDSHNIANNFEVKSDYDNMWKQLNKYWEYLSTLKK